MEKEEKKLHIVMFPWLAFGHMIPYLQLSKLIAQKGHKISFISTPNNINRLPKLPSNLINFISLPLPPIQNLPQNAEATNDLTYHQVKFLKLAFDQLQEPVSEFLQSSSPDWIFHDFAPHWLGPVANKLNIPTAYFSIFTAFTLGFAGPTSVLIGATKDARTSPEDFTVPPKWIPFETTLALRLFEILRIFQDAVKGVVENVSDSFRMGSCISNADVVVVRSCFELEPEWLKLVQEIHRKPVWPVGELPPVLNDGGGAGEDGGVWSGNKDKGSVVYVAFGSEAKPSRDELNEIALGLELSGLPFFWVLRTQRGAGDTELTQLPEGFEERVKGRGVMWRSWAPQLKILSHDSVGGLLTHAGWSTVVEAVAYGRALILLTFLADQGLNARFLEEKRLGYSVPRNELDGSFTSNSVASAVRLVMAEEEGRVYREKVMEMKGVFGDHDRQDKHVDSLLSCLQSHKRLQS
ncbi:hypothetical protein LguiA_013724 [Lonicera macranthoides]